MKPRLATTTVEALMGTYSYCDASIKDILALRSDVEEADRVFLEELRKEVLAQVDILISKVVMQISKD